jgi:hypothetical protein
MSSQQLATGEEVLQLLRDGNEVRSLRVSEELKLLDLSDGYSVRAPIRFVDLE